MTAKLPPTGRSTCSRSTRVAIACGLITLISTPGISCDREPQSTTHPAERAASQPVGPDLTPPDTSFELTAQPILGAAINAHHISRLDWYLEGVDAIADLGANTLVVLTPMWMEHVEASEIRFLSNRCPSDEQLIAILNRARSRGLSTFLLPIVLLEEADEKEWRGVIRPRDWDAWWTSYMQFLDRFISIASRAGVDALYVGSELNSTESQTERWKQVAAHVRARFHGPIGYSANWDRFDRVNMWNLFDFMAVSSYFELVTDGEDPTHDRLTASWEREQARLLRAAHDAERPLILSEVGYPSLSSAARYPWNYLNEARARADHEMQARCFRAFFDVWTEPIADETNRAAGFFVYHYDPYNDGHARDTGYGWRGKPSRDVIARGFAEIQRRMEKVRGE